MELNRKKPFGTVYGDPRIGYEQDGFEFKHDGTLHAKAQPPPVVPAAPSVDQFPTASSVATANDIPAPQVMQALEKLSSQIKELTPEPPKPPDPARSEKMRKIWVERRAREAAANTPPST
jgi:acyl-CoA thioesterase